MITATRSSRGEINSYSALPISSAGSPSLKLIIMYFIFPGSTFFLQTTKVLFRPILQPVNYGLTTAVNVTIPSALHSRFCTNSCNWRESSWSRVRLSSRRWLFHMRCPFAALVVYACEGETMRGEKNHNIRTHLGYKIARSFAAIVQIGELSDEARWHRGVLVAKCWGRYVGITIK